MGIGNAISAAIFLLAYKLDDSAKHGLIVFVRTGTHADLFE
jgi:mRNA interferase YafQ